MKRVTAEDKILLWVAASGDAESGVPAWLPERMGVEESSRLVEAAVREGVAGLLYHRLKTSGRPKTLADPLRCRLESIYYLTIQTNLRFFATLKEIGEQGVPFVLIQGAALLADTYQDPGLRPLTDIDVWALPGDSDRLLAALERLGFEANPLTPGLLQREDILVDVHTHLDWAERIRTRRLATDAEQIYRRCRPRSLEGVQVLSLDSYDQVTYLMVHAIKHNLERLIWLADIQRLVTAWQAADWEGLRQRAGELRQERVPAVLAYLRQEIFRVPTPAAASAGLTLSAVQRHLLRMRKRGPLPKWSSLMLLTAGNRVRQIEFAFESMFPRPEILRQVFTDRLDLGDWQLFGLRVRQLLGMMRKTSA